MPFKYVHGLFFNTAHVGYLKVCKLQLIARQSVFARQCQRSYKTKARLREAISVSVTTETLSCVICRCPCKHQGNYVTAENSTTALFSTFKSLHRCGFTCMALHLIYTCPQSACMDKSLCQCRISPSWTYTLLAWQYRSRRENTAFGMTCYWRAENFCFRDIQLDRLTSSHTQIMQRTLTCDLYNRACMQSGPHAHPQSVSSSRRDVDADLFSIRRTRPPIAEETRS